MSFNQVWDAFVASLPALKDAWPTVVGLMILAAVVGYGIAAALSLRAHGIKDQRVALAEGRVADYKDRLEGRTPDQAATQILELRAQISELKSIQPWTLTREQLGAISGAISGHATGVRIVRDVGSARLEAAQSQLVGIFEEAGWAVQHWPTMGKPNEPHENITINASRKANQEALIVIRDAFRAAGIPISEQEENTDDVPPMIWLSAARKPS
jgi:hypothetical protein